MYCTAGGWQGVNVRMLSGYIIVLCLDGGFNLHNRQCTNKPCSSCPKAAMVVGFVSPDIAIVWGKSD